jgi:hypothetical protein
LKKSTWFAPALDVTKFKIGSGEILVTLCCADQAHFKCSTNPTLVASKGIAFMTFTASIKLLIPAIKKNCLVYLIPE